MAGRGILAAFGTLVLGTALLAQQPAQKPESLPAQPISVEGQLVVFAYNNDKPNPDSKVPDRKFAFTPEQFTQHYTPSEL